ncbi:hypothetical protein Javan326_0045 [Streptococcus phage Javan326]|nr:hypothetical protein Javan326_0045 [Streptococcus phage Javan326]
MIVMVLSTISSVISVPGMSILFSIYFLQKNATAFVIIG